jgi:hypothetical protein
MSNDQDQGSQRSPVGVDESRLTNNKTDIKTVYKPL